MYFEQLKYVSSSYLFKGNNYHGIGVEWLHHCVERYLSIRWSCKITISFLFKLYIVNFYYFSCGIYS